MTNQYKPIVCAFRIYNLKSREKFEPGPGLNLEPPDLHSNNFHEKTKVTSKTIGKYNTYTQINIAYFCVMNLYLEFTLKFPPEIQIKKKVCFPPFSF